MPATEPGFEPILALDDGLSELEASVAQAIEDCGGDPHAAVRALIVANMFLETELTNLRESVSRGQARALFHRDLTHASKPAAD